MCFVNWSSVINLDLFWKQVFSYRPNICWPMFVAKCILAKSFGQMSLGQKSFGQMPVEQMSIGQMFFWPNGIKGASEKVSQLILLSHSIHNKKKCFNERNCSFLYCRKVKRINYHHSCIYSLSFNIVLFTFSELPSTRSLLYPTKCGVLLY